ncbi:MAG: DNA-binding transcriptional regulator [Lentisphaeria bacterium]|nr:DNA-binding transcriptional regulator [Lentisphaeria bacterium]
MPKRRVLLLLKKYNHPAYEGIIAYAREHGWHLELRYDFYRQLPDEWHGHGIISHHSDDPEMVELIRRSGTPTVDIGFRSERLQTPQVWQDSEAIGKMAAEYFLAKGFQHFGFYKVFPRIGEFPWNFLRYKSFKDTVEAQGCSCTGLGAAMPKVSKQLCEAPKPLAVLANNDLDALTILDLCEEADLRIPEEVAVLGVDNNPDFCELARIPLSSIDSNGWQIGYDAARLLDRLIDGEPAPPEPILVAPGNVITRQSTDILAVPHLPTARALRLLMENFENANLDLNAVATKARLSRRNLEAGFHRHLGHSMHDYLEKIRLDKAVELLENADFTNYKGYEIAAMCGFSNNNHLTRTLKKHYGKSLRQMRTDS